MVIKMKDLIKVQGDEIRKKCIWTEAEGDGYTDTTPSGGDEEQAPTVAVQPDFELIAFDFVSNPSTQGAFMSPGKMNESVNDGVGTRKGACTHDCKIEGIINDIFRGE